MSHDEANSQAMQSKARKECIARGLRFNGWRDSPHRYHACGEQATQSVPR